MAPVILVKISVTVPAIVACLLQQRLTALTVLMRTATPIQTAMMQTALAILHVHTAVTVHVIPVKINVAVPATVASRL
jgi:hypothetical protein